MIRPDAIPLLDRESGVTLTRATIEQLFGRGYRLRGSERVLLLATGGDIPLPLSVGESDELTLDRLDADRGGSPPFRLSGPRGSIELAAAPPPGRRLILPASLRRAWRLEEGQRLVIEAGTILLMDVLVAEGSSPGLLLDRVERLAAGLSSGDTARLRRDVEMSHTAEGAPTSKTIPRRLITENDVRQARLKGLRLEVQPGQLITPAARSLGRELGVLD